MIAHHELVPTPSESAPEAKARLMSWAAARDARRVEARSRTGAIVKGGAISVLGGLVVARMLSPGRRGRGSIVGRAGAKLVGWTLMTRADRWLLPWAINLVQRSRAKRSPSGDPRVRPARARRV